MIHCISVKRFNIKVKELYSVATGQEIKPTGGQTDRHVKAWIEKDLEAQIFIGLNVNSNIARKIANCKSVCRESLITNTIQKLHHFRTAWDNVAAADKNLDTLFERLCLEEDRLNETKLLSTSHTNAFISKQSKQFVKAGQQETSTVQCFKCSKNEHVKKHCRNKPSAKCSVYCRENYSHNNCKQRGHFARECRSPKLDRYKTSDKLDNKESKGYKHKALVTVGLSIANINEINLQSGIGVGDVELEAFDGGQWYDAVLENVLYVPNINFNLLSVTQALDKGYVQIANADLSVFKTADNLETVAIGRH
ncbi:uncharacterized protein LOC126248762 [Schistocerca nitens]|uniref:uncharacterized protein LOC126248762 n=1 Tax=Schistocerca nitens TaxID=7011 RepID=UPI0021180F33|nr:uncharacterized protein LOC126248762 [Schistocerca nitens]